MLTFPVPVSLDVLKCLTNHLREGQTYDDVLREKLGIDSVVEPETPEARSEREHDEIVEAYERSQLKELGGFDPVGGFVSRGLRLPNGTLLRARYKGREYRASIVNDEWQSSSGQSYPSPSSAASAITQTNVNGLRFWAAQLPDSPHWLRLDVIGARA